MRRLVAFLMAVAERRHRRSAQIVPCSAVSDRARAKILLDDIVS